MTGEARREIAGRVGLRSARQALIAATSEAELMTAVIDQAVINGWLVFHDTDSRKNPSGLPDLILVRPPRVLFVELKKQDGRIRPDQQVWLDQLAACSTVETHLWRPGDRDQIDEALKR